MANITLVQKPTLCLSKSGVNQRVTFLHFQLQEEGINFHFAG